MKFKKKKVVKYRGSKTHGCGSMKKRRGAGHRGGRGNAGSGKRGDAKKQTFQVKGIKQGKFGFTSKSRAKVTPINLCDIQKYTARWLEEGKIKDGILELSSLGYNKLLGTGKITEKLIIKVDSASQKAVEKVSTAGGKVDLPGEE